MGMVLRRIDLGKRNLRIAPHRIPDRIRISCCSRGKGLSFVSLGRTCSLVSSGVCVSFHSAQSCQGLGRNPRRNYVWRNSRTTFPRYLAPEAGTDLKLRIDR